MGHVRFNVRILLILFFLIVVTVFSTAFGEVTTTAVDTAGNAGSFSSLAIDSNNVVHISHAETDEEHELRYCNNTAGSWSCIAIETGITVAQATSLAIDSSDVVHLSYDENTGDNLRYCNNTGGTWSCASIETSNDVGEDSSLAIDTNDVVHISHYDKTNTGLRYCNNTAGSWSCTAVETSNLVGEYSSLAIDSNNVIHISHFDDTNNDLRYCNNTAGSWSCMALDDTDTNLSGTRSSLAIDSNDVVHISHYENENNDLRYCNNTGGSWSCLSVETIGDVGGASSLVIGPSNIIHISHYDDTGDDWRYCNNTGGTWSCSKTVDGYFFPGSPSDRFSSIKKGRLVDSTSFSDSLHISWYDTDLEYTTINLTTSTYPVIQSASISPTNPSTLNDLEGYCNATGDNSSFLYYDYRWSTNTDNSIPYTIALSDDAESDLIGTTWNATGAGSWLWIHRSDSNANSGTGSYFGNDTGNGNSQQNFTSTAYEIPSNGYNGKLSFWLHVLTESGYDGCYLNYRVNLGNWTLWNNTYLSENYNGVIDGYNALYNDSAWNGNMGDLGTVEATFPAEMYGQNITFRFVMETDEDGDSAGGPAEAVDDGCWIDDINLSYKQYGDSQFYNGTSSGIDATNATLLYAAGGNSDVCRIDENHVVIVDHESEATEILEVYEINDDFDTLTLVNSFDTGTMIEEGDFWLHPYNTTHFFSLQEDDLIVMKVNSSYNMSIVASYDYDDVSSYTNKAVQNLLLLDDNNALVAQNYASFIYKEVKLISWDDGFANFSTKGMVQHDSASGYDYSDMEKVNDTTAILASVASQRGHLKYITWPSNYSNVSVSESVWNTTEILVENSYGVHVELFNTSEERQYGLIMFQTAGAIYISTFEMTSNYTNITILGRYNVSGTISTQWGESDIHIIGNRSAVLFADASAGSFVETLIFSDNYTTITPIQNKIVGGSMPLSGVRYAGLGVFGNQWRDAVSGTDTSSNVYLGLIDYGYLTGTNSLIDTYNQTVIGNTNYTFSCRAVNEKGESSSWLNATVNTTSGAVTTADIIPDLALDSDQLNATCVPTTPNTEDYTIHYRWYKNNIINISGNSSPTQYSQNEEVYFYLGSGNTSTGEEWIFSCAAEDSKETGIYTNSSIIVIGNKFRVGTPSVEDDNQSQGTPFVIRANITSLNPKNIVKFEILFPNTTRVNYTATLESLTSLISPTYDVTIWKLNPDYNYEGETLFNARTDDLNASTLRGLIKFDITPENIVADWDIDNISFKSYPSTALLVSDGGNNTVGLYNVTKANTSSAVTWNSYDGTNSWDIAGGDLAETPFTNISPVSSRYNYFNLSSQITQGETSSYTWMMRFTNEDVSADDYIYLNSNNNYDNGIEVSYTYNQYVLTFNDSEANGTYTISNIWVNDTSSNEQNLSTTITFVSSYVVPTAPTNVTTRSPSNLSETSPYQNGTVVNLSCSGSTDVNYDTITYVYYADTVDGTTDIGNSTSDGVNITVEDDNTYYWKCAPFDGALYGENTSLFQFTSDLAPTAYTSTIIPADNALPSQDLYGYCNVSDTISVSTIYYKWYNDSVEAYSGTSGYGVGLSQDWKIDQLEYRSERLENKFEQMIDDTHILMYYKGDTYRDAIDYYQAVYPQFAIIEIDDAQTTASLVGEYSHFQYWEDFDIALLNDNKSVAFVGRGSGHDLTLVTVDWEGGGNYTIDTCTQDISDCDGYGEGPGNGIANYDGIVYLDDNDDGQEVEIITIPNDDNTILLFHQIGGGVAGVTAVDLTTFSSPSQISLNTLWDNTTVDAGWNPDIMVIDSTSALVAYENLNDHSRLDIVNWSSDYTSYTVTNVMNVTSSQARTPYMEVIDSTHILIYYLCVGDDACAQILSHDGDYGNFVSEVTYNNFITRFFEYSASVIEGENSVVFGYEGPTSDGYLTIINWSDDFSTMTTRYDSVIIDDQTGWDSGDSVWPAVMSLDGNKIFVVSDDLYERMDAWMYSFDDNNESRLVSVLDSDSTSDGETWKLSCAGADSYFTGTYLNSTGTSVNDGPAVNSLGIYPPSGPYYTETNFTGWANGTHALQSTVAFYWSWYKNDILNQSGGNTSYYSINTQNNISSLNFNVTEPNDVWTFRALATDGTINSSWSLSSEFVITNRIPVGYNVSITPDPALGTDRLKCNWTYSDGDNNSEYNTTVNWYVNDGLVETDYYTVGVYDGSGFTWPRLESTFFSSTDVVRCDVTVNDGYNLSSVAINDTITISNTAPTFTSTNLVSDPSQKSDTLTCSVVGRTDPDGDGMTNYFTFYDTDNVTVLQSTSTDSTYGCSVDPACTKGDEIICIAYVADGTDNSTNRNDSVSIINTKPVAYSVFVNPGSPDGSENLTCEYDYSDADSDIESDSYFKWFLNNTLTGNVSNNISTDYQTQGDKWSCEVTVYDGEENSTSINSSQVTIGGATPNVVLFSNNQKVDVGDLTIFNWSWSDPQLPAGGPYTHYVCNSSNITTSGCQDTEICQVSDDTSPSVCNYTTVISDDSSNSAYVAIKDGAGLLSTIASNTWDVNHYPNATNVTFNVTSAGVFNTYTCLLNGVLDSDSDSTTIYYTFLDYQGTVLQEESTTNTYQINTGSATHGHPVNCSARVSDARVYSINYTSQDHYLINQPTYDSAKYINTNMKIYVNISNSSSVIGINMSIKNPYNSLFTGFEMALNNDTGTWEYDFAPNIIGSWQIKSFFSLQDDGQGYIYIGDEDTFLVTVVPEPSSGDSAGSSQRIQEIPRISSNITAYCGDSLCQEGETPANCWQDCKVNYDSIVTCIWDEDIECNWDQTWFPLFLIILLGVVGIAALYSNEVRKKGGKRKRSTRR